MGLHSRGGGGLIIGRIFASEIWGAYFQEGSLFIIKCCELRWVIIFILYLLLLFNIIFKTEYYNSAL